MTFNWEEFKVEIERLYMKEGKSLQEVQRILKTTRNFHPSIRAYKSKLDEWGYKKYSRSRIGTAAESLVASCDPNLVRTAEAASALLAGSDSETVKRNLRQMERELENQASAVNEQRILLGKVSRKRRRQYHGSDTEVNKTLENLTKLEVSNAQMRKAVEKILASLSVLTSGPTGFASCWKQDPMILEDAHGKILPLPIELVISWTTFENLLVSHFQAIPGEKKVQKREFAIEDSVTRDPLTRKRSWSELSKPGRKIDMSMVFKDIGKTSVVCPKCNTISKEGKGVQVEWSLICPNPECKMIFRTEDEEDPPITSPRPRRPKRRKTMQALRTDLETPCEEEPEDTPGMFKRVIIRVLKRSVDTTNLWTQLVQEEVIYTEPEVSQPSMIHQEALLRPDYASTTNFMSSWASEVVPQMVTDTDSTMFQFDSEYPGIGLDQVLFGPEPFAFYPSSLDVNGSIITQTLDSTPNFMHTWASEVVQPMETDTYSTMLQFDSEHPGIGLDPDLICPDPSALYPSSLNVKSSIISPTSEREQLQLDSMGALNDPKDVPPAPSPSPEGGHRRRRSKRRGENLLLRPHHQHKKERIVIIDSPPTQCTPPQFWLFGDTLTARSSPAIPSITLQQARPIIVDERPIHRVNPIGAVISQGRRARSQSRSRFKWDSPSSSHTSFDSRARHEAEELEYWEEQRRRAERDERIAELEAERRREERIRQQDEEIRRRPPVPFPPTPLRQRQFLRPVIDQSQVLQEMVGGLNLNNEARERALITEAMILRRMEERDRAIRARMLQQEEEALKQRLRERQMPKRRFSVGPGNRRHRVLYDDGIYRWE